MNPRNEPGAPSSCCGCCCALVLLSPPTPACEPRQPAKAQDAAAREAGPLQPPPSSHGGAVGGPKGFPARPLLQGQALAQSAACSLQVQSRTARTHLSLRACVRILPAAFGRRRG